jgi:glycine/D-amino acid oxidase-like deaminating enzyme
MTGQVIVIGAGIIGMCAATYLQRSGLKVTVLDTVAPGKSCSFGNAGALSSGSCVPLAMPGVLRQLPKWLTDDMGPLVVGWRYLPRALPWLWRFVEASRPDAVERSADALIALTRPLFENLLPLVAEARAERFIQRVGQLHVYSTEAAFQGDRLAIDLRRRRGVTFEVLAPQEIRQLEPALAPIFKRAVWFPDHGHCANPFALVEALAGAFLRNAGQILARRVLDLEFNADGAHSVVTDSGPMPVETLLVAAGAWSHRLASKLGHKVPLETQRGYHALLADPNMAPRRNVQWSERKFIATPMETGLRFAGTVEIAGLDAPPNYRRADKLVEQGREMFPGLAGGEISRWMGHRPCLPDSVPVIGPSTRVKNTFFAFGHGHIGLTCAATTGRLIADLVTGQKPCVDPAPYRIDRF